MRALRELCPLAVFVGLLILVPPRTLARIGGGQHYSASSSRHARCPRCSAPLTASLSSACDFCGAPLGSSPDDWLLSSIRT